MDFYGFLEGFQRFSSFGWFWEGLGVGSGIWFPQHGKCSHENEKTIVLSLQPPRIHNNKMLILSFSWLHFSCGRHFLGHCMHLHASTHPCIPASMHRSIHPSMHVCIKICSIVLYQMAPSTWKVQPRKRENHRSVLAAPQNSHQQNVG